MARVERYECDDCGAIDQDEYGVHIKQCAVCDNDICEECQDEHSKEHCFP